MHCKPDSFLIEREKKKPCDNMILVDVGLCVARNYKGNYAGMSKSESYLFVE